MNSLDQVQFDFSPGSLILLNIILGVVMLGGMALIAAWWGVWHLIAGLSLAGGLTLLDRRRASY